MTNTERESIMSVDADLATLRNPRAHWMDRAAATNRVEAELARLTARRSRYTEARYENCMEALSAAEAELSRLREERDAALRENTEAAVHLASYSPEADLATLRDHLPQPGKMRAKPSWDALDRLWRGFKAAEAECARLRRGIQALTEADMQSGAEVRGSLRRLLAGPSKPREVQDARLREERDAYRDRYQNEVGARIGDVDRLCEQRSDLEWKWKAAEARCARLQEALTEANERYGLKYEECARLQQALAERHRWIVDALSRNQIVHEIDRNRARAFVADWEALAAINEVDDNGQATPEPGPDTPADSSGQWCLIHNIHQDDPRHDYDHRACEGHHRPATPREESELAARAYVENVYPGLLRGKRDPNHPLLSALAEALRAADSQEDKT